MAGVGSSAPSGMLDAAAAAELAARGSFNTAAKPRAGDFSGKRKTTAPRHESCDHGPSEGVSSPTVAPAPAVPPRRAGLLACFAGRRTDPTADEETSAGPQRVVEINPDSDDNLKKFASNYISTTKYSLLSFLPKFLWEQITRFSNAYFLFVGLLYTSDDLTPIFTGGRYSTLWTLSFVVFVALVKDAWEDLNRLKNDREVNRTSSVIIRPRKFATHGAQTPTATAPPVVQETPSSPKSPSSPAKAARSFSSRVRFSSERANLRTGEEQKTSWAKVRVGDIVKISRNEPIPADLILLRSSDDDGLAYIETKQLDGESNLKVKLSIPAISDAFATTDQAMSCQGTIKCDPPNDFMYRFNGSLTLDQQNVTLPITYENFLLRGCTLRNTDFVFGIVVNTGRETKLMMNIKPAPVKTSSVERRTNRHYLVPLIWQLVVCFYLAIRSYLACRALPVSSAWYLGAPTEETCSVYEAFLRFFTFFITFAAMIPIALNVFIEIARVFHVLSVADDQEMVDPDTGTRAEVRTSNLTTDLGQISYVFSDKTGTLTANKMVFKRCSVNGQIYNWNIDQTASALPAPKDEKSLSILGGDLHRKRASRSLDPKDVIAEEFFRVLSVCHAVVCEEGKVPGESVYQSSSPDEVALAQAASDQDFTFKSRTNKDLTLSVNGANEVYELLAILEFDSTRKRMSVIAQDSNGAIKVYCKGADSVILDRLAGGQDTSDANKHINSFAVSGLRTLALAYRQLPNEFFSDWISRYSEARSSAENRDENVAKVCEEVENELTLVGITAIEDKLQDGVPETLQSLLLAGIKVWVLTGDKQETAINIGLSSGIFSDCTDIVIINEGDIETASAQIDRAIGRWTALLQVEGARKELGLVVDGATVFFLLKPELRDKFVVLGSMATSVIGCRLSPKQKAELVEVVRKNEPGKLTLGIGDGANDVGMIRAAHVGVGIVGVEGQEARLASDFSFGQFRFLKKLLLVHGRWFYKRITKMALFTIYKNVYLSLNDVFWAHFNLFSGQPLMDPWLQGMYNLFFTAIPPIFIGALDQELTQAYAYEFPEVYRAGQQNTSYNLYKFSSWMATAVWHAGVTFLFCYYAGANGPVLSGRFLGMWSFGITVYFVVMATVLAYIWLYQSTWNALTISGWWLSVLAIFVLTNLFSLFALVTNVAPNMHYVVPHMLGFSKTWLLLALVPMVACIPRLTYRSYRRTYHPRLKVLIQELKRSGYTRADILAVSKTGTGDSVSSDGEEGRDPQGQTMSIFRGEDSMGYSGFNYDAGVAFRHVIGEDLGEMVKRSESSAITSRKSESGLPPVKIGADIEVMAEPSRHRRARSDGATLGQSMDEIAELAQEE